MTTQMLREAGPDKHRMTVRCDESTYEKIKYWAEKSEVSVSDFVVEAVELKIRHLNDDYDVPTMTQARIAQLIELVSSQNQTIDNLTKVFMETMSSFMSMARGSDYLNDPEDGELDG